MLQALAVNPAYTDVYFSLGTLYADHLNEPRSRSMPFADIWN